MDEHAAGAVGRRRELSPGPQKLAAGAGRTWRDGRERARQSSVSSSVVALLTLLLYAGPAMNSWREHSCLDLLSCYPVRAPPYSPIALERHEVEMVRRGDMS
jgi:hypothetical protein